MLIDAPERAVSRRGPEEDREQDALAREDLDMVVRKEIADEVDPVGAGGEGLRLPDHCTERGRRRDVAADHPEAARVRDGGGQRRPGDHRHAGVEDRRREAEAAGDAGARDGVGSSG
jgi:hypothetical protein